MAIVAFIKKLFGVTPAIKEIIPEPDPLTVTTLIANLWNGIVQDELILPLAGYLLIAQVGLTLVFLGLPIRGPWNDTAVFTAKQVITLTMMVYQTYYGFVYWLQPEYHATPSERVVDEQDAFPGALFLSRVVLGMLLQDIPIGILTGAVDTIMQFHHLGMFLVATISLGYWAPDGHTPLLSRYAPFFFGVIELSSIPLALVDMFHPKKQPEWYHYHLKSPFLQIINQLSRTMFVVMYFWVRMFYFPKVIGGNVLPDCYKKWYSDHNKGHRLPIGLLVIKCVLFTLLQLYWGTLILRQVKKGAAGPKKKDTQTATNNNEEGPPPKIKAV